MSKRWFLVIARWVCVQHPGGMWQSSRLYPVSGKVLHNGEPAAGAVVYFHQEGPSAPPSATIPFGIVEDDGSFSLRATAQGNGCPPASTPSSSSGETEPAMASCR